MVILGLDASSEITGWSIIESNGPEDAKLIAYGEIILGKAFKKPADPLAYLHVLFDSITDIIKKYGPTMCCIEEVYNKNVNTFKVLCKVRGVCEVACLVNGIREIRALNASSARKTVLGEGNGGLDKVQVCTILEKRFGEVLATKGHDQSDAILLAICGAKLHEWTSQEKCRNTGRPATKPRNGRSKGTKR